MKNKSEATKLEIFKHMFLKHHRNAQEVIFNKNGQPLAAVYFTPVGIHQEEFKNLMREIQNRVQYAGDAE